MAPKKPRLCVGCNQAPVTWPAIICVPCRKAKKGKNAVRNFRRAMMDSAGYDTSVVSGGAPTLGKKR